MNSNNTTEKILDWRSSMYLPFHVAGALAFSLGIVIAWSMGSTIDWNIAVLSALGGALIVFTAVYSLANSEGEYDQPSYPSIISSLSVLLAIGVGVVLWLIFETGDYTLPLGAAGAFCAFFYTTKPFKLAYTGIGEALAAACYGVLTVNAAFYLQTGDFSSIPALTSIAVAISIFLVILSQEIGNYDNTVANGNENLATTFRPTGVAIPYIVLHILSLAAIVGTVFLSGMPRLPLLLAIVPLAITIGNMREIIKGRFEENDAQERMFSQTLLFSLAIIVVYLASFIAERQFG
ncbi:MAG: prenyltransferase [Chloroflexota bacterium]|nr:prenyltransferase [Chloroflexota bacterium]